MVAESALRELLRNLMRDLDSITDRDEILAAERKLAKSEESINRFGLGQLVGVYREAHVFDKLRKHLTSNIQKVKRINWVDLVNLRNSAAHDEAQVEISVDDAVQVFLWLKILLHDTELAGTPIAVERVGKSQRQTGAISCPECHATLAGNWKFCHDCGTCMYSICGACDRPLDPTFKICPYCETLVRRSGVTSQALHEYEMISKGAYLDHVVSARERKMLEQARLKLGLSSEQAEEIEQRSLPANIRQYVGLAEGACIDGIIGFEEREFLDRKMKELKVDPEIATEIEREALRLQPVKGGERNNA